MENIKINSQNFELYIPDRCTGAFTHLYLRSPEDGVSAPNRVGFFKTCRQLLILLCASVGKCD
jgi:hypothetical protein